MADGMTFCLFSFAATSRREKFGLQSEMFQVQIGTGLIFDIKVLSCWCRNENEEKKKKLAWILLSASEL